LAFENEILVSTGTPSDANRVQFGASRFSRKRPPGRRHQRDKPRRFAESPPNQDTILVFPRLSFRPAGVNLAP
jgi:hypothetical protein